MSEDRRLVDQCREAAREAVRAEMAPLAESRGRQTEQIQGISLAFGRIEHKIDEMSSDSRTQMLEWQTYKSRIHSLEKAAAGWEIFQTNYQGLDEKLDSVAQSVQELTAARVAEQEATELNRIQEHKAAAEDRKNRMTHRWMLFMTAVSSISTLVVTLILHFLGVK